MVDDPSVSASCKRETERGVRDATTSEWKLKQQKKLKRVYSKAILPVEGILGDQCHSKPHPKCTGPKLRCY